MTRTRTVSISTASGISTFKVKLFASIVVLMLAFTLASTILLTYVPSFERQYTTIRAILLRTPAAAVSFNVTGDEGDARGGDVTIVTKRRSPSCATERRQLVYVKTHKTASETLSAVFRRFGFTRNLSFVLPVGRRNNLGWPYALHPGMYRPSKTGQYDILCEHAVLSIPTFQILMPNGTAFLTSIREPFSHFLSAFYYFNVTHHVNLSRNDNPVKTFLNKPDYYDAIYKTQRRNDLVCIPLQLSVLQNSMAFDLGYQVGFPHGNPDWTNNVTATGAWLRALDKRLDLVLLTEYFDESLVLLRRQMCWTTKDILYISRNPTTWRHLAKSGDTIGLRDVDSDAFQRLAEQFRRWSRADVALYEHFSRKFWRQISAEGGTFWTEVRQFRTLRESVLKFCSTDESKDSTKTKSFTDFSGEIFTLSADDCRILASRLMPELKAFYDSNPVKVKPHYRKAVGPPC